jgi:RNA polymerase sigma-70 factor (ECF subfamily)
VRERETEELDDDRAAAADPLRDLLERERAGMVEHAVGALPVLQREALILFEYEELSLEEIAVITGADSGAVKARLFRARESLRRRLAPLMAPCPEGNCG